MANESNQSPQALNAARNKQIDEYYKVALQGLLSGTSAYRDDSLLVSKAMGIAIRAYTHRADKLGATFSKSLELPDA